jgi:hypothetical protein
MFARGEIAPDRAKSFALVRLRRKQVREEKSGDQPPFPLVIFSSAELHRNPTLPACFLKRDWKECGDALELAIQIPQRQSS